MHRFARLIAVPVLLGTLTCLARAESVSPEQATELLAKTQTIDSACKFLSVAEHDDLSNLVARAELALAQQQSVAAASAALARGKATGQVASCNDVEKAEVNSILNAAKTASLQAPQVEPQQAQMAEPEKPVEPAKLESGDQKPRMITTLNAKLAGKKLKAKDATSLSSYASLTQRYYLQRRCGIMRQQEINALYQYVVATHQRTLLAFGRASTAAAMHRAEALARIQTCS